MYMGIQGFTGVYIGEHMNTWVYWSIHGKHGNTGVYRIIHGYTYEYRGLQKYMICPDIRVTIWWETIIM